MTPVLAALREILLAGSQEESLIKSEFTLTSSDCILDSDESRQVSSAKSKELGFAIQN